MQRNNSSYGNAHAEAADYRYSAVSDLISCYLQKITHGSLM